MVEFKLSDYFSPFRLMYWRHYLWKSQYFTRDRQRQLQRNLLIRILRHSCAHVPYYREFKTGELFKDPELSIEEILAELPVINKDRILEKYGQFESDNMRRYHPSHIRTSGTTGKVLDVIWDVPSNVMEILCQYRHFTWSGYRLGDPFLDIRSMMLDQSVTHIWNWKCRGLQFSIDLIKNDNIHFYAALLKKYSVRLWRGHPSAIDRLCILLQDAGLGTLKPRSVISVAETLLDNQRERIENWTGVRVCENYGLKEHNVLITQCPEGNYHINSEYGIVEILKDDGTPALTGEEGHIVGTGLHNHAFPLIRYDTGDYAVQSDRTCSCGRRLPLIEKFTGRIDDRILHAHGYWVSGLSFSFHKVPGIYKAQLVQNQIGSIDVYIIPGRDYPQHAASILTSELKNKLGEKTDVNIRMVDEIPFPAKGKYKFVVCRIDKTPHERIFSDKKV